MKIRASLLFLVLILKMTTTTKSVCIAGCDDFCVEKCCCKSEEYRCGGKCYLPLAMMPLIGEVMGGFTFGGLLVAVFTSLFTRMCLRDRGERPLLGTELQPLSQFEQFIPTEHPTFSSPSFSSSSSSSSSSFCSSSSTCCSFCFSKSIHLSTRREIEVDGERIEVATREGLGATEERYGMIGTCPQCLTRFGYSRQGRDRKGNTSDFPTIKFPRCQTLMRINDDAVSSPCLLIAVLFFFVLGIWEFVFVTDQINKGNISPIFYLAPLFTAALPFVSSISYLSYFSSLLSIQSPFPLPSLIFEPSNLSETLPLISQN